MWPCYYVKTVFHNQIDVYTNSILFYASEYQCGTGQYDICTHDISLLTQTILLD